jgi:hypothetical protein
MSRTEKIVAFLLGALVFAGLFVFIFTSLRTPPAAPPLGDTAFDMEGDEPFDFDAVAETETEPGMAPGEKETAPPAPPAPVNAGKK